MGDRDDGAGKLLKVSLEPGDRFGVEMIGGLIEQQQVGLLEQDPAERDPAAFPARQRGDIRVAGREPQRFHGDIDLAIEIPKVHRFDPFLQGTLLLEQPVHLLVRHRLGESGGDRLEFAEQRALLPYRLEHVAADVEGRIQGRLLGQVPDPDPLGRAGIALKIRIDPGHDAQQRALPGAVGAEHSDLRAREECKVNPLQDFPARRDHLAEVGHGEDVLGIRHRGRNISGWRQ